MYQFLRLILPPSLFCDWFDKEVTVKMDVDISKLFCQELQLKLSPKKCMDWGCKKYRGIFVHSCIPANLDWILHLTISNAPKPILEYTNVNHTIQV